MVERKTEKKFRKIENLKKRIKNLKINKSYLEKDKALAHESFGCTASLIKRLFRMRRLPWNTTCFLSIIFMIILSNNSSCLQLKVKP